MIYKLSTKNINFKRLKKTINVFNEDINEYIISIDNNTILFFTSDLFNFELFKNLISNK